MSFFYMFYPLRLGSIKALDDFPSFIAVSNIFSFIIHLTHCFVVHLHKAFSKVNHCYLLDFAFNIDYECQIF